MGHLDSELSVLPIALRGYLVPAKGWKRPKTRGKVPAPAESVLILDMETTMDPAQRLTFGSFQQGFMDSVGKFVCLEEGLVHDDELAMLDPAGYACLQRYVQGHHPITTNPRFRDLRLWSRSEFMKERFLPAIRGGTLIVGFNLPFDLTRLAIEAAEAADKRFAGGFSMTMHDYLAPDGRRKPNGWQSRFRFKTIDSKRCLMGMGGRRPDTPGKQVPGGWDRGRLLDLRHAAFALTDRKQSLESAAAAFGITETKSPIARHGVITTEYIDYNRQDVTLTARLLEAVLVEWARHPIAVSLEAVMSPAAVVKGYLIGMGLLPPRAKFKLPADFLGAAQGTYFGGRAEDKVRRVPVPVVYLDFRSMYPTVNTLMRMWDVLTAAKLDVVKDTAGVRRWMAELSLEQVGSAASWPDLLWFAKIRPHGDILPVRAQYDPSRQGTAIGVNPLWSDAEVWVAGPDLVTSFLLTGQRPEILEAVRLVPRGKQPGLRPTQLRGELWVDPSEEDFFRRVVELRHQINARTDLPAEEKARLVQLLKVLANSGSYGILAELHAQPRSRRPAHATVYGIEGGTPITTHVTEELGEFWCGPLAALTTAGARLMLALLERRVTDLGGQIAFGDTDSAAIVSTKRGGLVPCPGGPERTAGGEEAIRALSRSQVDEIVASFIPLNPYDQAIVQGSILNVEAQNCDAQGRRHQLWAFAISAKRYALFTKRSRGRITMIDAKEHGLGHLLDPSGDREDSKVWIAKIWEALILEALGGPLDLPPWVDQPAMTRITVSTPALWRPYRDWNAGKSYADQVKPMNFGLSVTAAAGGHPAGVDPARFHLFGLLEKDPTKWLAMEYVDRYSGKRYRIGVGRGTPADRVQVKSVRDLVLEYRVHPEAKSLGPDSQPCGRATIGLLRRRPVHVESIVYIGKESNALEEVEQGLVHAIEDVQPRHQVAATTDWELVYRPALQRISLKRLVELTGLTTRVIRYYWNGKRRPSPEVEEVLRVEVTRWARTAERRKSTLPQDKGLAERVLAHQPAGLGVREPAKRRRRPRKQRTDLACTADPGRSGVRLVRDRVRGRS